MLSIFVRHSRACLEDTLAPKKLSPEKLRTWKHCDCPKWYTGTLEGKHHPRAALGANTWEEAEKALDRIKGKREAACESIAVEDAFAAWLDELALNRLESGTIETRRTVGEKLAAFCKRERIFTLQNLDAAAINRWRKEWEQEQTRFREVPGLKRNTKKLRLAIVKTFFKFTRRMRWLKENPMDYVITERSKKGSAEEDHRTQPLDESGDKNYRALLAAITEHLTSKFIDRRKRTSPMGKRPAHLVCIVELMYETGLRVSDAIEFLVGTVKTDTDGWGEYTTRQIKTGDEVTVAIPPGLLRRIQRLEPISPGYVFCDGSNPSMAYRDIWIQMKTAGESIGLQGVRPHRLRDSFAVNRLNEGMLMQDVSKLLGHANIGVTERYYAPFVKSRKDALIAKRKAASQPVPAPANVVPIRKQRAS